MIYTVCLLVLAAGFVIRVVHIAARRRRERTRARARPGDGRPPASVHLHLLSLLPLAGSCAVWA